MFNLYKPIQELIAFIDTFAIEDWWGASFYIIDC